MARGSLLATLPQVEDLGWGGGASSNPTFSFTRSRRPATGWPWNAGRRLSLARARSGLDTSVVPGLAAGWMPPLGAAGPDRGAFLRIALLPGATDRGEAASGGDVLLSHGRGRPPAPEAGGRVFVGTMCFAPQLSWLTTSRCSLLAAGLITARQPERASLAVAGLAGLAVGIVAVNPYFPGSPHRRGPAAAHRAGAERRRPGHGAGPRAGGAFAGCLRERCSRSRCLRLPLPFFPGSRIAGKAREALSCLLLAAVGFWLITLRARRAAGEYATLSPYSRDGCLPTCRSRIWKPPLPASGRSRAARGFVRAGSTVFSRRRALRRT